MAIAIGFLIVGLLLWLRECGINPLLDVTRIAHRPWFERLLLIVFICGVVHYGSTKGFLGAPLTCSPVASVQLPTIAESDTPFPAYTNAVTNLCFTGILPASTSVFLRAAWPSDTTIPDNAIEIYARHDLTTNGWEGIGTVAVGAVDGNVIFELPHAYLPVGWTNSMFFVVGLCLDTDNDGLSDAFESLVSHTNPSSADSDSDGDPDGWEVSHEFDPNDATPQISPSYVSVTNLSSGLQFGFHGMATSAVEVASLASASSPLMLLSSSPLCRDGLPQIPDTESDDPDNEFSFSTTGSFTPAASGTYEFVLAADDNATFSVGSVSVSVSWSADHGAERSASGHFECGKTYRASISYDNDGAYDYFLSCGYRLVSADDEGDPGLLVNPGAVKFSVQAGSDLSAFAPDVSLTGTFDSSESYTVEVEAGAGLVVERGAGVHDIKVYPDAAYDGWSDGVESLATFKLTKEGEVIDTKTCLFICEMVKEDGSQCCCNEGTKTDNGCISFSQSFGSSPAYPGIPSGRILVTASRPSPALYTTAALRFDHPMMRRIRYRRNLDARVVDGLGRTTEYVRGMPGGVSSGGGGQLFKDSSGNIVEELADGLRVIYDGQGKVSALQTEFSAPIPVASLGITVNRAADGSIASVVSASDGTMSATSTGSNSWRLSWNSPSGSQVKHFDFGGNGSSTFTLHEYRSEDFQFDTTWTYDSSIRDFIFEKGGIRNCKSIAYNNATRDWTSIVSFLDANGIVTSSESTTLNRNGHSIQVTSRRDAMSGRELESSTLDASGRIATEIDSLGACTSYLYDSFGRVTNKTVVAVGVPTRTTIYEYTSATEPADYRPIAVWSCGDGELLLEEEFEYGTTTGGNHYSVRARTCGGMTRLAYDEYDANGRKVLAVSEGGRARRTIYANSSDGGVIETADEGVVSDWAIGGAQSLPVLSSAFSLIDGKSTRTVRNLDAAGNAVRIDRFALVGGEWRQLDWETHAYNATHKVVASSYSDGTIDAADWICTGPVYKTGRDGVSVSNEYDSAKLLSASTRYGAFGAVKTEYVHDNEGRVIREIMSAANCETQTVIRVYDSRGRIVSETDAHGVTSLREYSVDDRTNAVVHVDGGTIVTVLNPDGSIASITGTAALPEFRAYSVSNGLSVAEVRYGRVDSPRFTRTFTDGFGDVVRIERSGCNGSALVTENGYDVRGNLIDRSETDKPNLQYAYDDFGDCTNEIAIAGDEWRSVARTSENVLVGDEVYGHRTRIRSCSDASIPALVTKSLERRSGLNLEINGESLSVDVRGNTNRIAVAADPTRQVRAEYVTAPGVGNVATNVYRDGAIVTNVSHGAVTTKTEYDAYRRAIRSIDGRGNATEIEYDSRGYESAMADALGNRTAYGYDAIGNLVVTTNAMNEVTVYEYDVRGRKTYEGGATYPVRYAYDVYGNKISMTTYRDESSGAGDVTTWLHDESSGAMTNKVYADGKGPAYEYDDVGRLTKRTWARGVVTTYAYDAWGNLTNTVYSDSTPSVAISYDAMGRQTMAIDAAGVTTFAYDEFGANTNETVIGAAGTNVIERITDAYGREAGYALNGVRQSTLGYDQTTGRLVTMLATGSTAPFTWRYLAGSDLKSSLSYPNGVTASWIYDNMNCMLQVRNASPTNVISQYDYTYDDAGRRITCGKSGSAFDADDTISYLYNMRGELTNAIAAVDSNYHYSYQYDDIGNRESATERGSNTVYSANQLNQYTLIDDFTPSYDDDGNQTLIKTSSGVWQIAYNAENRPVLWTSRTNTISMSYDRMGRRVTKNDRRFVYKGYLQVADTEGNSYVWDPTEKVATRPLEWFYDDSATYYTHDGNKNVSEVVFSGGTTTGNYEYAPFGIVTAQYGISTAANPWRFSGEYADDDTSTVYYNFRCFTPETARWAQRDNVADTSCYRYLANHMSEIDILGQAAASWGVVRNVDVDLKIAPYLDIIPEVPILEDPYRSILLGDLDSIGAIIRYMKGITDEEYLTHCPCDLQDARISDGWSAPVKTGHEGGDKEVRREFPCGDTTFGRHRGQQCVYDRCGNLINTGRAAGTPDDYSLRATDGGLERLLHGLSDAKGYTIGKMLDKMALLFNAEYDPDFRTRIDHFFNPPDIGMDRKGNPCPLNDGKCGAQ